MFLIPYLFRAARGHSQSYEPIFTPWCPTGSSLESSCRAENIPVAGSTEGHDTNTGTFQMPPGACKVYLSSKHSIIEKNKMSGLPVWHGSEDEGVHLWGAPMSSNSWCSGRSGCPQPTQTSEQWTARPLWTRVILSQRQITGWLCWPHIYLVFFF